MQQVTEDVHCSFGTTENENWEDWENEPLDAEP